MLYMLGGGTNNCVFGWIKPLVAVATYSFHRLIMEKSGNMRGGGRFLSQNGYLDYFCLQKF